MRGEPEVRDLGFGSKVAGETTLRLLNPDGSFNVSRDGLGWFRSVRLYELLHRIPWWQFYLTGAGVYVSLSALFAIAYVLCGAGALSGTSATSLPGRFAEAFFFSVQTITTVGYGIVSPVGTAANVLVAVEAFLGLGGFAVAAAIVFARLARPRANILFSKNAVVAPYGDGHGFMFRVVNGGTNQLLNVRADVLFTYIEHIGGRRQRRFTRLPLERDQVTLFPLHWTVVHPIDGSSPFRRFREEGCELREVEVLILITGVEEMFSETVHARRSYRAEEIQWDARFSDVLERRPDGGISIDIRRIHRIEALDPDGAGETSAEP